MKVVYPEYFKNFRCIASECEDTCCAGWEVVVDKASAEKYKCAKGEIGERLRNEMKTDSEGDIIFTLKNGRCPFLDECNLCDIYKALGENSLCHTCTMFPRFVEDYGGTSEMGLGLACPEAARMIVNFSGSRELQSEFNSDAPMMNSIDPEEYFTFVSLRKKLFVLADDSSLSFEEKLIKLLTLCGDENPRIPKAGEYINKLLSLDILTDRWEELLSLNIKNKAFCHNKELSNILYYYIYRYFLRGVYDGDILSKARLCVMACVVINALSDENNIADIAHLFSKEVEYSAENISTVSGGDFYADLQ